MLQKVKLIFLKVLSQMLFYFIFCFKIKCVKINNVDLTFLQISLNLLAMVFTRFYQTDGSCKQVSLVKSHENRRGSARHIYVVCIYGAIYLQIQKYFPPDAAFFSSRSKILILLSVVSKLMPKKIKNSCQNSKI